MQQLISSAAFIILHTHKKGEIGGLLMQHLTQCNYINNGMRYVIRSGEGSLGKWGGWEGVDSSEVFVIPYLIVGLTAIKMFNLRI